MSVALFVESLLGFGPLEARSLDQRLRAEGSSLEVYALVWPDYPPQLPQRPEQNREAFASWREASGVPLWAWLNASALQDVDVAAMRWLDRELEPAGWLLDIEGAWTKTANLRVLANGCAELGRPRRASLAGGNPSLTYYDYRSLDLAGFELDWQAYLDSGEGPPPETAVRELHRSTIVVGGWEYRHHLGKQDSYGWGKVTWLSGDRAGFDSYRVPGEANAELRVAPREFGATVLDDGRLRRGEAEIGLLMGRAEYRRIRVTLDVTRGFHASRSLAEWALLAKSARAPNARVRPASIYCGSEPVPHDVVLAIARGAR